MTGRSLRGLAVAAYVFGYPLVSHLTEVCSQTTDPLVPFAAPVNLFGHATALSGLHDFRACFKTACAGCRVAAAVWLLLHSDGRPAGCYSRLGRTRGGFETGS